MKISKFFWNTPIFSLCEKEETTQNGNMMRYVFLDFIDVTMTLYVAACQ